MQLYKNTLTSDNFKWHEDDDDLVSGHDSLDKDEKIYKDYSGNALMDNGCALCVRLGMIDRWIKITQKISDKMMTMT